MKPQGRSFFVSSSFWRLQVLPGLLLHHPNVCITPVSASSPPCLHHHPHVHIITPVSTSPPCLHHPRVWITLVSASSLRCLHHPPGVCITPLSTSPLCPHHPCVWITPVSTLSTCLPPSHVPPPPRHLCVPSSSTQGTRNSVLVPPSTWRTSSFLNFICKDPISINVTFWGSRRMWLWGSTVKVTTGVQKYSKAWCPTASLSHQQASSSLLFSSIRGQTEWKPKSQKSVN